jgi:hypothetical protein
MYRSTIRRPEKKFNGENQEVPIFMLPDKFEILEDPLQQLGHPSKRGERFS